MLSFIDTTSNTSRKVTNHVVKQSFTCVATTSMTMGEFCTGVDESNRLVFLVPETEAPMQGFEDGLPITLSPLARGDEKFFEPGTP